MNSKINQTTPNVTPPYQPRHALGTEAEFAEQVRLGIQQGSVDRLTTFLQEVDRVRPDPTGRLGIALGFVFTNLERLQPHTRYQDGRWTIGRCLAPAVASRFWRMPTAMLADLFQSPAIQKFVARQILELAERSERQRANPPAEGANHE
jgi:hypothetical protein